MIYLVQIFIILRSNQSFNFMNSALIFPFFLSVFLCIYNIDWRNIIIFWFLHAALSKKYWLWMQDSPLKFCLNRFWPVKTHVSFNAVLKIKLLSFLIHLFDKVQCLWTLLLKLRPPKRVILTLLNPSRLWVLNLRHKWVIIYLKHLRIRME